MDFSYVRFNYDIINNFPIGYVSIPNYICFDLLFVIQFQVRIWVFVMPRKLIKITIVSFARHFPIRMHLL